MKAISSHLISPTIIWAKGHPYEKYWEICSEKHTHCAMWQIRGTLFAPKQENKNGTCLHHLYLTVLTTCVLKVTHVRKY